MSNNKAFTKHIGPVGSGEGESSLVHQCSPSWVLSFVRWEIRDTLRTGASGGVDSHSVREPLVVENDCLQASVSVSKGTLTPSMNATLVQTDVNYMSAVFPGDFVFVNMLNWDEDARRVANNARALRPLNGPNDGFKGIFKVQSVRKAVATDPNTGAKMVIFKITGFAFTELNNTIYFNPYLVDASEQNLALFVSNLGNDWSLLVNNKGLTNVQDIMKSLIESFIGTGMQDNGKLPSFGFLKTANTHFFIPQLVGTLLGVNGATAAKDIYTFLFGVQQYAGGSAQSIAQGMNPQDISEVGGRFLYTGEKVQGETILKCEYWNQVKAWSILNQFTNSPLNELFTCFRISPNNRVMPTLVFRQIPFTSDDFDGSSITVTKFMNVPRWKISPAMVMSVDIGRDEAARINFVQYFGRSTLGPEGWDVSSEIAAGNYVFDGDDVSRSGLRPYIVNVQFDEIAGQKDNYRSPDWAEVVGNALIGGHAKLNGTIECAGIVDPIAVGDNLEFDGVVFHIEQITHTCSIAGQTGGRTFRTTINLSSGISNRSSDSTQVYSEMAFPKAEEFRKDDFNHNQLLPGVSESQDVVYRKANPDKDDTPSSNKPFIQPTSSGNDWSGDDTKE